MADKFYIIVSNYYEDIADNLVKGAVAAIEDGGAEPVIYKAPGALEIPPLIASFDAAKGGAIAGFVALGCVIRGETAHFDIVANESARALMELGVKKLIPIGNGILTVENMAQAAERADPGRKNKGEEAARAAMQMAAYKKKLKL